MLQDKILIVDDNPINLKLVTVLLNKKNFDIYTASDAIEALKVLEKVKPKLILMDIQLPGLDGLQLTRQLKSQPATKSIIIIALTAYAMKGAESDEAKALAAGCDAYISKPINVKLFPDQISGYLDKFS